MKWLILIFIFGIGGGVSAQENLVLNPSFEEYKNCPDDYRLIDDAKHWYSVSDREFAKASLMHACSENPKVSPPLIGEDNSDLSYQVPHTGLAYAKLVTQSNAAPHAYIGVALDQTLKENHLYYVRFEVAYAEKYASPAQQYCDCIGAKFFNSKFTSNDYTYKIHGSRSLGIEPDIDNDHGIIRDTLGWTTIDSWYKAEGGEKHLVLGNFRYPSETAIVIEPFKVGTIIEMLIDDVGVYAFDPLPDTLTLCPGESATYDASFLESKTRWSTGEETAIATINTRGWHYVDAIIDNVVLRDSMYVMMSDLATIAIDTLICEVESFAVEPKMTGDYIWSTGETTPSIAAYESGIYSATITDDCTKGYYDLDLTIEDCECDVFLPNAVSANYDGINDDFEAMISCLTDYTATLAIYNRYGGLVFEQDYGANERVRWRPEQLQHLGVYVYVLTVETPIRKRQYSGSVTLLR